jgi:excisionase family DNA binding protein
MQLFTIQETAAMLKVSPMTIRRYIASGKLAAVRVGRRIRVEQKAIKEFVEPVEPETFEAETEKPKNGIFEEVDGRTFYWDNGRRIEVQPFTFDDPLWNIVGIIDDDGPTDASVNTDKYLAEAYADTHNE